MNPYDWQSHNPEIAIPRPDLGEVADMLAEGGSAVVLGGRGMGKSVFLQQICEILESRGGLRVVVIPVPPPELTVRSCLDQLARALGASEGAFNSREILDAFFAGHDAPKRLVLLFDEFDRYAEKVDRRSTNPPGRGFFNDLEATRRDLRGLGVLATGSIGVFVVRDVLGSSFLARALHVTLSPFRRVEIEHLFRPLIDRGTPPPEAVLDALQLTTGGIPALVTFGLQQLWRLARPPAERDVTDIFTDFVEGYREYVRDLLRAVSDEELTDAPKRVWRRISSGPGALPRAVLEEALGPREGPLRLDLVDALHLLQATGLVRFGSRSLATSDPIVAHPIAGLLNLPASEAPPPIAREHLRRDLGRLLAKLHRSSADFFRPVDGKRLVPESVLAAYLALGFELLGWQTEREAQNAAGRTDLKLRRNGSGEVVVIEMKIWGRNDYLEAQRQIESYWSAEVVAGAVVQITDSEIHDWVEIYRQRVEKQVTSIAVEPLPGSPIQACLLCKSETLDGLSAEIDHFLLRLPRRS